MFVGQMMLELLLMLYLLINIKHESQCHEVIISANNFGTPEAYMYIQNKFFLNEVFMS